MLSNSNPKGVTVENVPKMPSRYLTLFFAETDLRPTTYLVKSPSGVPHQIPTEVVLEHIAMARGSELKQIEDIIRKIDFHNGDLHDFLEHLARAIAAKYEEDRGTVTSSFNLLQESNMSDLKDQLIRLGSTNPEIRRHIKPVLASLGDTRVARSADDPMYVAALAFAKAGAELAAKLLGVSPRAVDVNGLMSSVTVPGALDPETLYSVEISVHPDEMEFEVELIETRGDVRRNSRALKVVEGDLNMGQRLIKQVVSEMKRYL